MMRPIAQGPIESPVHQPPAKPGVLDVLSSVQPGFSLTVSKQNEEHFKDTMTTSMSAPWCPRKKCSAPIQRDLNGTAMWGFWEDRSLSLMQPFER
uniref:Uncharacterized protein n=1 Tax=Panagrellus redivivus TaxID=6233 RepID=A0A7E4ZTS7_PANRE